MFPYKPDDTPIQTWWIIIPQPQPKKGETIPSSSPRRLEFAREYFFQKKLSFFFKWNLPGGISPKKQILYTPWN